MKEWDDPRYKKLLVPSIFNANAKNIAPMIKLFEETK